MTDTYAKAKHVPTSEEVLRRQKAQAEAGRRAKPKSTFIPLGSTHIDGGMIDPLAEPANRAADLPAKVANTAVAMPDTRSNVERYLDDVAPSGIVGRLIKFTKNGEFATPDTDETIGEDVDFIALCAETLIGWIKFNDNAPPTRAMGLLYSDFAMPPRESLGDLDESRWPMGLDGHPSDPWQHQQYLVLQHGETSELYTFATSSKTGRRAIGNLLRHYERMQKTHPDMYPVIRLKKGGFNHRDERIGWVATPALAVVGRAPKDSAAKPDTSVGADINDDIPF